MRDQAELLNKIRVAATAVGIDEEAIKNWKVRACVNTVCDICTFAILFLESQPFALQFDTSVICHVVIILCLGSFLLQDMF